jgi:CopG family transcriptional regulator, nickel-responsive regulator
MATLSRFGVSIESPLLDRFDKFLSKTEYINRSEAIRDLIRARLVDEEVTTGTGKAYGVLTLVYDHHQRELEHRLNHLQHDHHRIIIATSHVHLDHDHCLEVVLLQGAIRSMQSLAASLAGLKGVTHNKLVLTKPLEKE